MAKTIDVKKDIAPKDKKKDLEDQIKAMKADLERKLKGSREHFCATCTSVEEKYLTVNGFMQVRDAVMQAKIGEFVTGDQRYVYDRCAMIARDMSCLAGDIRADFGEKLEQGEVPELEMRVEFDNSFVDRKMMDEFEVAEQLCVCSMFQGLGGLLEDMREFKAHAEEEIAKLENELKAL